MTDIVKELFKNSSIGPSRNKNKNSQISVEKFVHKSNYTWFRWRCYFGHVFYVEIKGGTRVDTIQELLDVFGKEYLKKLAAEKEQIERDDLELEMWVIFDVRGPNAAMLIAEHSSVELEGVALCVFCNLETDNKTGHFKDSGKLPMFLSLKSPPKNMPSASEETDGLATNEKAALIKLNASDISLKGFAKLLDIQIDKLGHHNE